MQAPSEKILTPEEEESIRESLKRCSPESVEAAISYRKTGDIDHLPVVMIGILSRFVEPDIRRKLSGDVEDLRLLEDLGLDSLTMVEVVMTVEESLDLRIENEELKDLRTIGDIKSYIRHKVAGEPLPTKAINLTGMEIEEILPHGHPFLFVETAKLTPGETRGTYAITGNENFLEGHFKGNPVFPASIMIEALGQLAILHLIKGNCENVDGEIDPSSVYFISCDGVRCSKICKPGSTLNLEIRPTQIRHPMASFSGTITVDGEKAAFAEKIVLSFDYLGAHKEAGES